MAIGISTGFEFGNHGNCPRPLLWRAPWCPASHLDSSQRDRLLDRFCHHGRHGQGRPCYWGRWCDHAGLRHAALLGFPGDPVNLRLRDCARFAGMVIPVVHIVVTKSLNDLDAVLVVEDNPETLRVFQRDLTPFADRLRIGVHGQLRGSGSSCRAAS